MKVSAVQLAAMVAIAIGACRQGVTVTASPAVSAPHLDVATQWTFVDDTGFIADGEITGFEAFVGATGRHFSVGVYRPSSLDCQFTLISQWEIDSLPVVGYNLVNFDPPQRLAVLVGDRYGFSWTEQGVVNYAPPSGAGYSYCEDAEVFDVYDVATLQSNRYGDRVYSFMILFGGATSFIGHLPITRPTLDLPHVMYWTFVDKEPIPTSGSVVAFELFVGEEGRNLTFGQYRGDDCNFEVIKLIKYDNFTLGYNRIVLSNEEKFDVLFGDRVGFTMSAGAVLKHSPSAWTDYYCESDSVDIPVVGVDVTLNENVISKRIYSFQAEFIAA